MSELSEKLDTAQSRSDQAGTEFLKAELAASFTFVSLAEAQYGAGERERAEHSVGNAEHGYATLSRFLTDPKHTIHMTDAERKELTDGMRQLRERLDRLKA
jgi:hypothetical protein